MFAFSTGLWFGRASAGLIGPSAGGGGDEASQSGGFWLLIPVVLNFSAAIASLSRAAILLCCVVFLVMSLYMIVGVWQKTGSGGRVKLVTAMIITIVMLIVSVTVFAPKALKTEIVSITPASVFERVSGRGQYHARIAKEIFRDHPVFGVGGWGYPHYLMRYLTKEERENMQIGGGVNVHNDTLQFLAEQGSAGYALMVLCVLTLTLPLAWQSLCVCRAVAASDAESVPAKPAWLYHVPPVVIAVFMGTTATICHSLGDLPFRNPAIVIVWVLSFVCASGFLPVVRKS